MSQPRQHCRDPSTRKSTGTWAAKSPSFARAIFVQVCAPAGQKHQVNFYQPEIVLKKSLNVINMLKLIRHEASKILTWCSSSTDKFRILTRLSSPKVSPDIFPEKILCVKISFIVVPLFAFLLRRVIDIIEHSDLVNKLFCQSGLSLALLSQTGLNKQR